MLLSLLQGYVNALFTNAHVITHLPLHTHTMAIMHSDMHEELCAHIYSHKIHIQIIRVLRYLQ